MLKVLHVLNHSVPHTDGYCVRSLNIVRFQREAGLDPVVITSPRQEPVPISPLEVIEGRRYYRTLPDFAMRIPLIRELQCIRGLRRRILEIIRDEKPHLIHAHSPCSWGMVAGWVSRSCGLPFVYEVRGLWEESAIEEGRLRPSDFKYRSIRMLETRLAVRATALVTISNGLRNEFISRGVSPSKLFVVPNAVDISQFECPPLGSANLKTQLGINGRFVIGYIGSLLHWEGLDDLIHAASDIIRVRPQTVIVIIGNGPLRTHLHDLVQRLSINNHVIFIEGVPHNQIQDYYSIFDALVYPRRRSRVTELVTPLKPLEAMAMGKPILISDVGGLRELSVPGGVVEFSSGDPSDLACKCIDLISNPLRLASLAELSRIHVKATRDWRKVALVYQAVYDYALTSPNHTSPNHRSVA